MDFQYDFRQAYKDRLEDAGVIQYHQIEDVAFNRPRIHVQFSIIRRIRFVLTAILNIFSK